jgi:hypothetical protein
MLRYTYVVSLVYVFWYIRPNSVWFAQPNRVAAFGFARPALFQIFVLFYVFFVLFLCIFCAVLMHFCVVLCIVCFVSFSVLFVCVCVLYYCHRVATQLQLNVSYHIKICLSTDLVIIIVSSTGTTGMSCLTLTYLLTPWSRVLLEKLTSKLCS